MDSGLPTKEFLVRYGVRIEKLGEERLIRVIQQMVQPRAHLKVGIGDDGLILKDGKTVMTTDVYAQGVHFDLNYMSYYDVGTRCACAALSDVVAMGAEPRVLVVGLALPRDTDLEAVRRLYQGMERVCGYLGCEIGGGDIVALDRLVICLTALGISSQPLLRSNAMPNDRIYLTGYAGLAETGRLILSRKFKGGIKHSLSAAAIQRHLCPMPRVEVMRKLKRYISALIDTSDGLGTDIGHISRLSGVRMVIQTERVPIHPVTVELCQLLDISLMDFVFRSGEDYELLFTSKNRIGRRIAGVPVSCIGRVEPGNGVYIETQGKMQRLKISGYDHLRGGL